MKIAFFDIDTQLDFMLPAGALYVPGAERLMPGIRQLTTHAAARGIPVVSSVDAHAEDDAEFAQWPPHCVAGTTGQKKVCASLLEKQVVIPTGPAEVTLAAQILVEKQTLDLFRNPHMEELLGKLGAEQFVVYGVVTEYCVGLAAKGLLQRGKQVSLVTDAIQTLKGADSARTLREIAELGGKLTTIREVLSQ